MLDLIVVGGGIVGLATAFRFSQTFPDRQVLILEKEVDIATHQTGHNSGVIHSGIYYKPGSLKAKNCRLGKQALEEFCEAEDIPFERCGKVIVATQEAERETLRKIYERGIANGVTCELIRVERLHELEPHANGIEAIHVPEAGIVNYQEVCKKLALKIKNVGGTIRCNTLVQKMSTCCDSVMVHSDQGDFQAKFVIACGGLQSDRLVRVSGNIPKVRIIPFRGEYYELTKDARHLCRNLIYPVPDPKFPFLGVHFTRMIEGGVECGPNAVLSLSREHYEKFRMNPRDLFSAVSYSGFRRVAARHWRMGLGEMWRSLSKSAFVNALQTLVPEIQSQHLELAPAGIRAQAVRSNGELVDDFLIDETDRVIHVVNAPSPAATASLNIGASIIERLASRID